MLERKFGLLLSLLVASVTRAGGLPSVASINLCTDQLLLSVADPAQIVSLSWLAADPQESMLADQAVDYPANYGSAEEILRFDPDIVIGGQFTSVFARRLLAELGFTVVSISPASRVADIERNLLAVARAIDREERGLEVVATMRRRVARLEDALAARPLRGLVVRPGGFTVGSGTLADELLRLAGIDNVAARQGLDSWGSLSLEALLRSDAELLILTGFRSNAPSLANAVFAHPALTRLAPLIETTTINATYWSCGAPDSLRAAEQLAAIPRALQSALTAEAHE